MRYDVIADVHGHADELEELLFVLGYRTVRGVPQAPTGRQAIFLGDFINRGPHIKRSVALARAMAENGHALAVMGNHEFNALACAAEAAGGKPGLEADTLREFRDEPALWASHLAWFATLPLYLDLGGLRIVHACWDDGAIALLGGPAFTPDLLRPRGATPNARQAAADLLLRGPEIKLPPGHTIPGPQGPRDKVRLKWWLHDPLTNYRTLGLSPQPLPDAAIPPEYHHLVGHYAVDAPPVLFGHYGYPKPAAPFAPNVACLDLAVARGGPLCAYRWNGERELLEENYVTARSSL